MAIHEIAKEFKIHRVTVSQHLERAGVTKRASTITDEQILEAADLYESGLSLAKIGKRLGFTARTIQLRLLDRGVTMRDTHGRERR